MKSKIIIAVLSIVTLALAGTQQNIWNKVYVLNGDLNNDRVVYIEDKETGTRCYGFTNNVFNTSGYALSCVPKEK